MTIVYILAAAPWGPVKIGTATDRGDMLRQVTGAPASVAECGEAV